MQQEIQKYSVRKGKAFITFTISVLLVICERTVIKSDVKSLC
jgi:hypothetical protein